MTVAVTPDDLLEFVERSPLAVAAHDKAAWLALFAPRHVVEDPVGGRPVVGGLYDRRGGSRGPHALSRFWDTYIAPRSIRFRYDGPDIVRGLDVVRNVTIEITDTAGVVLETPAYLLYELTTDSGPLRIGRLAAHWEVGPVVAQLAGFDRAHTRSIAQTNIRLLKYQGLGGAFAFGRAMRSVGNSGKAAVAELVSQAQAGSDDAVQLFGGAVVGNLTKVIASGDVVVSTCVGGEVPAVLFCYLDRRSGTVVGTDLFTAPEGVGLPR
ncbi:transporter [Antrihabitans spumae]|uniref:Transporter n=1 Tax=Antrihabitans spumae TaxID=3373370 RepID=A0ABW7KS48_9NOCA